MIESTNTDNWKPRSLIGAPTAAVGQGSIDQEFQQQVSPTKGEVSRRISSANPPNALDEPPKPMPALFWRWLKSRHITSLEQIDDFLTPSLSKMIHPLNLLGMREAIARLKMAFEKQESICVYGDYDLDGSSGIALLVNGLKGLGFKNVSFYQPSRFLEGYGIHSEALDIIAQRGDKVVISVDCGITAVEEARHARELGLDLIITDHHLARKVPVTVETAPEATFGAKGDEVAVAFEGGLHEATSAEAGSVGLASAVAHQTVANPIANGMTELIEIIPECLAVVNPNQKKCRAQLEHLCGVGVGFYVLLALKAAIKNTTFDLKSLLDFFTIGTITDMVPLKGENRVLVKHGLKILSKTSRPGLKALMQRLELWGRDLDSQDIGFTLAPKLNALARLELGLRPLDIFLCEDPLEAEVLAEQVIATNDQRKKLQTALEEKIMAQVDAEIQKPVVVLAAEGHAGVVGLVATRVAQATGKPAFIVAIHNGEAVGSARGQEEDGLPDALAAAASSLERFGGHAQAAGFSLAIEKFAELKAALVAHYEKTQAAALGQDSTAVEGQAPLKHGTAGAVAARLSEKTYDVEARISDFNESFMSWLQHAGPFGSENPLPRFKLSNPFVTGVRWLKGQHLKLTLSDGGRTVDALAFFAQGQFDVQVGQDIEVLVEPGWNYFRGQRSIQLIIRDLRPSPKRLGNS